MIDPIHSLAFSIKANPGVFAVLLGSGVSRSARIPTGWEITLDLVRKLASVEGKQCKPDPETWFREKHGQAPDYSVLLDALAKTPAERQQLLREYIEPTAAEREEGAKAPTPAHRAIADLAAKGHIRLIITTNFDRLMETALNEVGVFPTVLSSADHIQGAMPLIHTDCCVIKVHGDYLDTRIRNTPEELAAYQPEFDRLLDRVFDEFGLIVCGWSAEWDKALRDCLIRAPTRRFSHFWGVVGELGEAAKGLVQHRQAQVIPITGADHFFPELARLVTALDQFSRPHPLSTEAAVASLKGYLAEQKYRIRLADLVGGEVTKVLESTSLAAFPVQGGPAPNTQTITDRVRRYEAACETLMAMAVIAGRWSEDWHVPVWQSAATQLANRPSQGGYVVWNDLQLYPATLLLYSLGLGAVSSGEAGLVLLASLLATAVHREHQADKVIVEMLPPFCLFTAGDNPAKLLEGMDRRYAPLNDWLEAMLRPKAASFLPIQTTFSLAFDKLEILIALNLAYQQQRSGERYWTALGCYGYRHENRDRVLRTIRDSLESEGDKSAFVKSGIFGRSANECVTALTIFTEWAQKLNRHWW